MLGNTVQTKSGPTSVNAEVERVGYAADRAAGEDVLGRKAGHVVAPKDRLPIVTRWSGMDDWKECPPDYDTWALQYRTYTIRMCVRFGVKFNVEDVAQAIMTRFMERDSLGVFTPDWGSKSATGRSNFRSYYTRFILTYVTGMVRNETRYLRKHSLIFDAPIGEDGTTWGDLSAPSHYDDLSGPEFEQTVAGLRERIDNDALVDAVLALAQNGPVRQNGLRDQLGCDANAARSGLAAVRAALQDLVDKQ